MYYASSSTEAFAEGGAGEPSHGRAPAKSYAQTAGPEVSYQIVHLHTGSAVQMRLWHGLGSPQHPQHPRDPQDPQDPQDRQGAVREPSGDPSARRTARGTRPPRGVRPQHHTS